MTIGETLAKARRDAGLTITQVSQRTCIRETIIRGIEQDDYSACGGDFYARGNIRSIARTVGTDPAPLIAEYDATIRAPEEITAAQALEPTMPIRAVPKRRTNWAALLAVVLLVVIGFLGFRLASSGPQTAAPAAASRPAHHTAARSTQAAHATHHKPAPKPTPTPAASPPTLTSLTPVSVQAFGPSGAGQGDNPQQAELAISGNPATPWTTDWYATPDFDSLQSGTGLLLDMGKPVTITSAQITLGSTPGANLQLLAGNVPALGSLQQVATADNAGGVLQLQATSQVSGRYLLLWFTQLPPDSAGTYQALVSGISLKGYA